MHRARGRGRDRERHQTREAKCRGVAVVFTLRRAFRECPTPARAEARAAVAISLNGPTSRNPPIASITSVTRSRRRRDGGARGETSFGTQRLEMTRTAARARERSCCASRRERKTPCARRWGYHRRARRRAGERMGETRGRGRAGETQRQRKDDETVATRRIRTRGSRRMQTLIPHRRRRRSLVVDDDDGGRKRRDANDANETAKTKKTREDGDDDDADRDRATPIATETETDRVIDRRDALAIESNHIQIFRRRPVPSRPVPSRDLTKTNNRMRAIRRRRRRDVARLPAGRPRDDRESHSRGRARVELRRHQAAADHVRVVGDVRRWEHAVECRIASRDASVRSGGVGDVRAGGVRVRESRAREGAVRRVGA